jgi:hypothetical protein
MRIKTGWGCALFVAFGFWTAQTAHGAILENAYYRVEITAEGVGSHPPGSLLEFSRFHPPICDALDGMTYAGKVTAGAYTPAPGLIQFLSDTEAVFASAGMVNSQGGQLPVQVTIFYKLSDDGLHLDWIVDCAQEVTFSEGLHFEWDLHPWEGLYGYNQMGVVDSFSIPAITGSATRSLRSA